MLHVAPNKIDLFAQKGGKSCQLEEYRGGEWTSKIVAQRLDAAFAPKHLSLDNHRQKLKPAWGYVTSHEDYIWDAEQLGRDPNPLGHVYCSIDNPRPMGERNIKLNRWLPFDTPARSDFEQLCCKGVFFGGSNKFTLDPKEYRTAYIAANNLLIENGFLVEDGSSWDDREPPEGRREKERQTKREVATERRVVRADPNSFQELVARDLEDREPYIVNGDLLALEAQGWLVKPMSLLLEFDRLPTLAWLKSGKSQEDFSRDSKIDPKFLRSAVHAYTAALAWQFSIERRPVKPIVRRLDYKVGGGMLQGVSEIANFLHFSIATTQKKLDAGLIPVASFPDGTIIASEKMILHLRDHHKRPERASSTQTPKV
jgi:hypothetical protein